ncbi:MAG TPA: hypothetical protein VJ924_11620 [Alphaproteobacteria bacterium]|nr:hypothetical protein [Alphaproteobacteria bacterium]
MSIQRWNLRRLWPLLSATWIAIWAWPTLDALQGALEAHRHVLVARREAQIEAAHRSRDPLARADDRALRSYLSAQSPTTFSLAVAERGFALRKARLIERVAWLVLGLVAFGAAMSTLYGLARRNHRSGGETGERG